MTLNSPEPRYARLGSLGCSYLQLDDTSLAYLNDPMQRDYVARLGGDREAQHLVYIDLINGALAGRPDGMTVCTHLCRGNFRSSWVASGGYDYVAEALFDELKVLEDQMAKLRLVVETAREVWG